MSTYTAEVHWKRNNQTFTDNRYCRKHLWRFDGGIEVPGSASPHVVPLPLSVEQAVDPEEAFVVSLSSCHMLWFLSLAAKEGFTIDSYEDRATGWIEKNEGDKLAMTKVMLYPAVRFSGTKLPTRAETETLHHRAHEECFIANSVRTEVSCEPIFDRT
jgi:organic hydroperoxide reductase OsmC/OhrA